MKKKLLSIVLVIGFALAIVGNIVGNFSKSYFIPFITDVEALANTEGGVQGSCSCSKTCSDGETIISCKGNRNCYCHSGSWFVECDGAFSYC